MEIVTQGILVLDKPRKISCAHLLNRMKPMLPHKIKLGHAGTLDPLATGVLLVLIGRRATLRSMELMGQPKRYRATVRLGATTPTLDMDTPEILEANPVRPTLEQVRAALPGFVGVIQQVPPIYCALKQGGRPLYAMARKGRPVQVTARPVQVYSIDLVAYQYPEIQIDVHCGRGTYIRSLARDIAVALGTTGYLTSLCRTAVGLYTLEQASTYADLTAENICERLVN